MLARVAWVVVRQAEPRGALLLHGGLACCDGVGAVLAGRSGAGKTTASQRLKHPWQALSDDATFIAPDSEGRFWAHPWPTWSSLGAGRTWPVEARVPLRAVFLLTQASADRVEPVDANYAALALTHLTAQTLRWSDPFMTNAERCSAVRQQFRNVATLVRAIPVYRLHLTLTGSFWESIARVLG